MAKCHNDFTEIILNYFSLHHPDTARHLLSFFDDLKECKFNIEQDHLTYNYFTERLHKIITEHFIKQVNNKDDLTTQRKYLNQRVVTLDLRKE